MKITQRILEEIADTYCTYGTPFWILAQNYGVSKTTIVRYFNGDRIIKLPEDLQQRVDMKKKEQFLKSKATYGNLDNKKLSKEEIIFFANKMLSEEMTLQEACEYLGLSKATIFNYMNEENLGSELYLKIVSLFDFNKKHAFDSVNGGVKNGR